MLLRRAAHPGMCRPTPPHVCSRTTAGNGPGPSGLANEWNSVPGCGSDGNVRPPAVAHPATSAARTSGAAPHAAGLGPPRFLLRHVARDDLAHSLTCLAYAPFADGAAHR